MSFPHIAQTNDKVPVRFVLSMFLGGAIMCVSDGRRRDQNIGCGDEPLVLNPTGPHVVTITFDTIGTSLLGPLSVMSKSSSALSVAHGCSE